MHPRHIVRRALQIGAVAAIQIRAGQHLGQFSAVMLLKQRAQHGGALPVGQVFMHRINKKQADSLNAAQKKLLLALKMVGNGAAHQERLHLLGQHAAAGGLAQRQAKAVGKNQLAFRDFLDHMTV